MQADLIHVLYKAYRLQQAEAVTLLRPKTS